MFEIDRLHIATKLDNNNITEEKYYAIFGNIAVELEKELLIVNQDEEKDEDSIEIYNQHLIDARAVAMKNHLFELKKKMSTFIEKNELIKDENYATFKYEKNKYDYYGDYTELVNNYVKTAIQFLDFENTKSSMSQLDKLAYCKAQKLFWEDKINDEISKREQEQIDEESDEYEE